MKMDDGGMGCPVARGGRCCGDGDGLCACVYCCGLYRKAGPALHGAVTVVAWARPPHSCVAQQSLLRAHTARLQPPTPCCASSPTPTLQIEYRVSDLSGNAAVPARRLLRLVCPAAELPCEDEAGLPACTVHGICGAPAAALAAADAAASSSGSTGDDASVEIDPRLPVLRIAGPAVIEVLQLGVYDRCTAGTRVGSACDPGAVAYDARDGNLDLRVRVCGQPLRATAPDQQLAPILLACNVSTDVPGLYDIAFSVENSAGFSAAASRSLIVLSICPAGERLCPDRTTCSDGSGMCPQQYTATVQPSAAAAAAPAIAPIVNAAAPALLLLPRGTPYAFCNGSEPGAGAPCEPGALAWSGDGLTDLTDRVVVCPPPECTAPPGCTSNVLRGHLLKAKGLAGCGLNVLAPPGAVFTISFWVWDDARPAGNATASRTVVITERCTDPRLPHFCSDGTGGYLCSPSPCSALGVFLPPASDGPVLTLLPAGARTVFIEYGSVPALYLGACGAGNDTRGCGAIAAAGSPKSATSATTPEDLTAYIVVAQTTPCTTASSNAAADGDDSASSSAGSSISCLGCSLESLAVAGLCLPGIYTFTYTVSDDQGRSASAQRTVVVYQHALVAVTLPLVAGLSDATAAAQLLDHLRNTTHPDYAAAVRNVTARLAFNVAEGDVDIASAELQPAASGATGQQDLVASLAVHIYSPAIVHRGTLGGASMGSYSYSSLAPDALAGASAGAAPGGASRRLLLRSAGLGSIPDVLGVTHGPTAVLLQPGMLAMLADDGASSGMTGGTMAALGASAPHPRRHLLQQAGGATNTTAALTDLAASISASLNATSSSTTVSSPPDANAGYVASLAAAVQALGQANTAVLDGASSASASLAISLGEQAAQADDARSAAAQQAFLQLLSDASNATEASLERSEEAGRLMGLTLAALAALQSRASDVQWEMEQLAADTQAQADRAIYDTLVMEEAYQARGGGQAAGVAAGG